MNRRHIKLEELLRLKRSERPTEAEWRAFDMRLKRKMMQSIVEKPSRIKVLMSTMPSKTLASYALAACALATAVLAPLHFSAAKKTVSDGGTYSEKISSSPLPKLNASFASNEISATMFESLVSAEIASSGDYMPNNPGGADKAFSF